MPNVNPKTIGDNIYPQYNRVITIPCGTGAITKGNLYTLNSEGYLVAAGTTRGSFASGLYQAAVSAPADTTAGTHTVQVYASGSRVLCKAPADLVRGDLVEYTTGTTNILKKLTLAASVTSADFLAKVGRLYDIYTQSDLNTPKRKTEANDLVEVELGLN